MQFTYNPSDELLTLTDGKNQTTTWNYDEYGRVTNKLDAAGITNFVYQYDPNGRLTSRWTPAKGTTVYGYDPIGNLTNVDYSGGTAPTPSISFAYDGLNRLVSMADGIGTTAFGWTDGDQLASETGPWPDDSISYTYANRLRNSLSLLQPNASPWMQNYSYDTEMRLTELTSPAGAFSYAFGGASSASSLISKLTLPNGGYITNAYDSLARLFSTKLLNSGSSILDSSAYAYDLGNERTQQVFTAGNYINYTYDNIGQLKSAIGKEAGGTTNRLQEQFGYAYDKAWNLSQRTNNLLIQNFGVNVLNELTNGTRSGTLTVGGTTTSVATNVTVNTSNAVLYADGTFAATNFTVANGNNTFTAIARDSYGRRDTNSITVNLPATNSYTYDANGNLTNAGNRYFGYDDENQLVSVWVANTWSNSFAYDGFHSIRASSLSRD